MNLCTKSQGGQIVLLLILIITVALAIGLSMVQRSLTDVSTASKVEQSSRALSAAEAGIERALQTGGVVGELDLGNNAKVGTVSRDLEPAAGQPLQYPPIGKEDVAQIWLADPSATDVDGSPTAVYTGSSIDLYWGKVPANTDDSLLPAIEATLVYYDNQGGGDKYGTKKYFIDYAASERGNGFLNNSVCNRNDGVSIDTLNPQAKKYYCKTSLDLTKDGSTQYKKVILIRLRLLYTSQLEPLALKPCIGTGCLIPPQSSRYVATGVAGETTRKLELFRLENVVPFYFDYAIFSDGTIEKPSE